MKKSFCHYLKVVTFYSFLGYVLQCFFLSALIAGESNAQKVKSIREVKINANFINASVIEVFETIESTTNYDFIYDSRIIKTGETFNLKARRASVADVLIELSRRYNLKFKQINRMINVSEIEKKEELAIEIIHQEIEVSGTVTDVDGEGIPGVNILLVGTSLGTVTDYNGKYNISVPSDESVLAFSAIGYIKEEIVVGNRKVIDITLLPDLTQLEEVVVVAYGTTNKSAFTGSAAFIEPEKIQQAASSNISNALQGLSPGVQVLANTGQPGADATIRIRGFGSLSSSNQPLIIVNGSPYEAPLSSIAPNEIESISILKDAASTSLYGSRAANGVILITTKSGKPNKTVINFRATWGTSDFAVALPDKLDAADQYEAVWEGFYYDNLQRGLSDDAARQNASDRVTDRFFIARPHTNFLGDDRQYRSNWNMDDPVGLDGRIKPEAELLYEYDWHDIFEPKLRQEYAFDLATGLSENTNLFASTSYLHDKGQYFNQDFRRWSTRLNLNSKLSERIGLEASLFYLRTDQNNPGEFARFIRTVPTPIHPYEFNHETGEFFTDVFGNRALQKGGAQSYSGRRFFGGANPFDFSIAPGEPDAYAFNINNRNQIINKIGLHVNIIDGLDFRTNIITDYTVSNRHQYISPVQGIERAEGFALKRNLARFAYTFNSFLEYKKSFGEHGLTIMAGNELFSWNRDRLSGTKQVFAVPGFFELDAGSAEPTASSFETDYRLVSAFSRLEYDYSDKIYLSASYRTDGSSRFSEENRWGNFWSVGAGWRLSEEAFMDNAIFVNNLKLKASYGTTGNDQVAINDQTSLNNQIALYAYQALYDLSYNFYENPGAIEQKLPTSNLRWEKNIQLNVGVEFELFDRFYGNIEYFIKTSDDLLFQRPLPQSFGITVVNDNIAEVQNKGFEIDLHYDVFNNRDFSWTVSVNATHYKNEILELPESEVLVGLRRWVEGRSIFEYWTPTWAGVDPETGDNTWFLKEFDNEGNVIGRTPTNAWNLVNNQPNHDFQGSSLPDLFGGVSSTIKYRGFDLSFMFYYSLGGIMLDNAFRENINMRNAFGLIDFYRDNHWTPENRDTTIPRPSHVNFADNGRSSNQYMFDNDFLRLRTVNLGYTFPSQITDNIGLTSLRVFMQAENPFTWGNAADRGTDPEIAGFDGSSDYNWGIRKTITGGVHLQF